MRGISLYLLNRLVGDLVLLFIDVVLGYAIVEVPVIVYIKWIVVVEHGRVKILASLFSHDVDLFRA
jgi:hypothetical protein